MDGDILIGKYCWLECLWNLLTDSNMDDSLSTDISRQNEDRRRISSHCRIKHINPIMQSVGRSPCKAPAARYSSARKPVSAYLTAPLVGSHVSTA